MTICEIPRANWHEELDSFSRQHEGWLVSLKVIGPAGQSAIQAHDLPLQGVGPASPQSDNIAIVLGGRLNLITHEVHDPTGLAMDLTTEGANRALLIRASDGTTTTLEFRSPMRPEEVDGLPDPGG